MIHSVMVACSRRPGAIRGSLEGSFNPARQARLEISYQLAITSNGAPSFELTIPCETYAIALSGKKSHS